MKLSHNEVNINNTIDLYFYSKNLINNNQISQWLEMYEDDILKQSINFGQPFSLFLMIEFINFKTKSEDIFLISVNFSHRINKFLEYCEFHNIEVDKYVFLEYLELLALNPFDLNIMEKIFHLYIQYVFMYYKKYPNIGIFTNISIVRGD